MALEPSPPLVITDRPDGAVIPVRVIPRAGRTSVAGVRGGALLVRLAAAPVDGAANDALVRLLAETFDVPRSRVALVSGECSRDKRIRVAGLAAGDVERRLAAILWRSSASERQGPSR